MNQLGFFDIFKIYTMHMVNRWSTYFYPEVERTKDHYSIPYFYGGSEYRVLCRQNKSKIRIASIYDEHNNNVTEHVKQYMGPGMDFHGIATCPSDMGYNFLIFEILNGTKIIFQRNENIYLTLS